MRSLPRSVCLVYLYRAHLNFNQNWQKAVAEEKVGILLFQSCMVSRNGISDVLGLLLSQIKRYGKVEFISCLSILFKSIVGTWPGKKSWHLWQVFASWNFAMAQFDREVCLGQSTSDVRPEGYLRRFYFAYLLASCTTPQHYIRDTAKFTVQKHLRNILAWIEYRNFQINNNF